MPILIREFNTPDDEMRKVVLKVRMPCRVFELGMMCE